MAQRFLREPEANIFALPEYLHTGRIRGRLMPEHECSKINSAAARRQHARSGGIKWIARCRHHHYFGRVEILAPVLSACLLGGERLMVFLIAHETVHRTYEIRECFQVVR